jgi:hypothetical protein
MMHRPITVICFAAVLIPLEGCGSSAPPQSRLAFNVDAASGGAAWRARHALAADLTVRRRDGAPDLHGALLYDTRNDRLVVTFPSPGGGMTTCGYNGNSLWVDAPAGAIVDGWPTDLQWAACVAVPYRLMQRTLRVREFQPLLVAGARYRVAELGRPADGPARCALFVDPDTLLPRGCMPVRTAALPADPFPPAYGFVYDQFAQCEDVTLPTRWSIRAWNARTGISPGPPIASVILENPRFVDPEPLMFDPPTPESVELVPGRATSEGSPRLEGVALTWPDQRTHAASERSVDFNIPG